jgi:hypothetical protein
VTAPLGQSVRQVLEHAVTVYRDSPQAVHWLRGHLARFDEPLRVAIAGKVKAGKSTLLNALVGEQIAPTDAGECTRVVTWYQDGPAPRVLLFPRGGPPRPLTVARRQGALTIDLAGTPAEQVDRLVVDWPSQSLRATSLIDTPGIASMSTDTSARAGAFLVPDDDAPTPTDAVLYLMRHLHLADVRFLEAFHDRGVSRPSPVNTVAVLSRADEIGVGRPDAMASARQIATRYRRDETLQGLCHTVVAVAGLLAETARTLRQTEFAAFGALAALPPAEAERLMLSADRFVGADTPVLPAPERAALLERFGLFGVRVSTTLLRRGTADSGALAKELLRRSGFDELRQVLTTQFTERRDLLKSRSALLALELVLHREPIPAAQGLAREVERITAGAHEFAELRLLTALRTKVVKLPKDARSAAERLLGGDGGTPAARLGLDPAAQPDELREAALEALRGWQRRAESPLADRGQVDAARTLVRTCEGLLATIPR